MSSWGFVPHRHLHAKAWASLPLEFRLALGNDPTPLVARATDANSRKHTDSLEAARHYLDLDDALGEGLELWGLPWSGAQQLLEEADSSASVRRLGILPWQLEWSYWRLVKAWAPSDSSEPDLDKIVRAAADLGHYLGDAHVPLHTSGNYDGQRTGQRGIHALWETHAVEWLLSRSEIQACPHATLPWRTTIPCGRLGKSSSRAMPWCPRCWRQSAHGNRCATETATDFADAGEPCSSPRPRSLSQCGTASPMGTPGHGIAWRPSALPPHGTVHGWRPAHQGRRDAQERHGENNLHCTFLNGGPTGSCAILPNHDHALDHLDL
ncbi:MAG: hypothetical protein VXX32_01460 [Bacteroidota bacterium]|nr:hypothetical protein [Bacteroidota bacterium]